MTAPLKDIFGEKTFGEKAAESPAGNVFGNSFGSRTDVGCIRDHNEDSLTVAPPLYVVCDGMGGHAAGEVASEIAINTITSRAPEHPDAAALGQAVEEANLAIIRAARKGEGREGMGTTCTAAMLEGERLVIAQVGDSRAYLLHKGHLQQITRDHSLVADLVESGRITPAQAKTHPKRSYITRALGSDPRTEPDLYEINVKAGDRLLLCSDGLSTMLEDEEIRDILREFSDPQVCASELVEEALAAGGHDNVTVIVVDVAGFAEARHRKLASKTKRTAALVLLLLALILGGAAFALNHITNTSAYLTAENDRVVIYRGIPGEFAGMSFSQLEEVTDVRVNDLQPGLANRLVEGEVQAGSVEEARDLVRSYEMEIAAREAGPGEGEGSANASAAGAAAGAAGEGAAGSTSAAGTEPAPTASKGASS